MFIELGNLFKVEKLEEVLRCSNEIFRITRSTQAFVRDKDSVFKTSMNKVTLDQQHQPKDNKLMVSASAPELKCADLGTQPKFIRSRNEISNSDSDISSTGRSQDGRIDLDQAFERSVPLQNSKAAKSMIVSLIFSVSQKKGLILKGCDQI